jgi:hypothetical protein
MWSWVGAAELTPASGCKQQRAASSDWIDKRRMPVELKVTAMESKGKSMHGLATVRY